MKPKKKSSNSKAVQPRFTLEITVKDRGGNVVFGHMAEGGSFLYDTRVKERQFSPQSFSDSENGVNKVTTETTLSVGGALITLEIVKMICGERLPFVG